MGIGTHTKPVRGAKDDWITPQWIIDALGVFDLDPCACIPQPWPCASTEYNMRTPNGGGLLQPWRGRVWLNPPYGDQTGVWLQRLTQHGRGTALIFARTETGMFRRWVWKQATALLFLDKRIRFHNPDGSRGKWTSGGPSVLVAYGAADANQLQASGIRGSFVSRWNWCD